MRRYGYVERIRQGEEFVAVLLDRVIGLLLKTLQEGLAKNEALRADLGLSDVFPVPVCLLCCIEQAVAAVARGRHGVSAALPTMRLSCAHPALVTPAPHLSPLALWLHGALRTLAADSGLPNWQCKVYDATNLSIHVCVRCAAVNWW